MLAVDFHNAQDAGHTFNMDGDGKVLPALHACQAHKCICHAAHTPLQGNQRQGRQ